MTSIIDNILKQKSIATKLENYTYVSMNNWDEIPLGSHIKFIDRNEKLKSGGFLIKSVKNNDRTKCYYILKSNIIYKLYMYYYWIFYKKITHESKISKKIKLYKNILKDKEEKIEIKNTAPENEDKEEKIEIKNKVNENEDKYIVTVEKIETIKNKYQNKNLQTKNKTSGKREAFLSLLNSLDNLKK
jgi:hypothetical protein